MGVQDRRAEGGDPRTDAMSIALSKIGLSPNVRCTCRHEAILHVIWDSEIRGVAVGHCFACDCAAFERL